MKDYQLTPAAVAFDGATLRAPAFGDVYFHSENGLEEARHVFLGGVGAPDLWAQRHHTVIAETGFGAGLNFLATWDLWRRTAAPGGFLHFVSVEGYPLARADLARALAPWTELAPMAAALIDVYPPPVAGFHPLSFDNGRVRLTLLYGEAAAALAELSARVDAWYLDGFAPDRNPEMWREEVMAEVARLSAPGARLASFTVAGEVRRALAAHGFAVEKAPGFGPKRECLRAYFQGVDAPRDPRPWFAPPPATGGKVAVIGGGIAGLMAASALADLGRQVTLHEAADDVASGASGNPAAVVEPWLDRGGNAVARTHIAAYLHLLRRYGAQGPQAWQPCGILRLLGDTAAEEQGARLMADWLLPADHLQYLAADEASAAAGIALGQPALYLPQAGLARPKTLAVQATVRVEVRRRSAITALQESDGGWMLLGPQGEVVDRAEAVVMAAALATARLAPLPLAFQARAGEITFLPPFAGIADLRTVLMFNGYLTPAVDSEGVMAHVLGATFDVVSPDNPVSSKGDAAARNLRALEKALPHLLLPDPATLKGRAGVRATTTDHLAILGGAPDMDHYMTAYEGLRQGKRGPYPAARYRPGLYVLTALGARGFLTAPLLAEALAAQVSGLPMPVERTAMDAFHPARFWLREVKRSAG